jgi:hypothetical protein
MNRLIKFMRTADTYLRNYSTLEHTMWQNAEFLNVKQLSDTFATGLEMG